MRVTCVLRQNTQTELSSADHQPTAGLSPVNRLIWLGQVQDAELGGVANAVAAALIRFHNAQTGLTYPSLSSLGRMAGFKERSVRTAIRALEASGLLGVTRRRARTSLYTLRLKPAQGAAWIDSAPASDADQPADIRQEAPVEPACGAAKQGKEPFTDRKDKPTVPADLDAERLARRVQQTSRSPWRLDNARLAVLEAIDRVGVDAVKALADQMVGVDLRAWEVRRRLEALTPSPSVSAPAPAPRPAPGATSSPSPTAAFATRVMEQADPFHRCRWHQRARMVGVKAPMYDTAAWVPAIAADFLSSDHPRAWERLQSRIPATRSLPA